MRFTLEIEMGNAAMRNPEDLATALHQVASSVQSGHGNGKIWDVNGNSVGAYDITEDESE